MHIPQARRWLTPKFCLNGTGALPKKCCDCFKFASALNKKNKNEFIEKDCRYRYIKMKNYLLLGISVLLLLFTLPKPPQAANWEVSHEQSVLKKACVNKTIGAKRTCQKKCLSHQSHSASENNAGIGCGSPTHAMLATLTPIPTFHFFSLKAEKGRMVAVTYLPPPLAREPNPPRFS